MKKIDRLIKGKYGVIQSLGKSRFGYQIYILQKVPIGSEEQTEFKKKYIGKMQTLMYETTNSKGQKKFVERSQNQIVLEEEIQVLRDIERNIDRTGFPKVYEVLEDNQHKVLITDIRSIHLLNLMPQLQERLTVLEYTKFCIHIIYDLFDRIESIHRSKYLHRNLRPDLLNFKKSYTGEDIFFVSDFSSVVKYNSYNYKAQQYHNEYKYNVVRQGKTGFASIWKHAGMAMSRRDDLESFCYIAIFLLRGCRLPWRDVQFGEDKKMEEATFREKLKLLNSEDVFESEKQEQETVFKTILNFVEGLSNKSQSRPDRTLPRIPKEVKQILAYVRGLDFEQQPDYNLIRKLLKKIMNRMQVLETDEYFLPFAEQVLYPKGC